MFLLKEHMSSAGYKSLIHTSCEGDRVQRFSPFKRLMLYVAFHFLTVMFGVVLSYIWWHNKFLNKLVLIFLYMTGVYNGGKLYIDRYSHQPIPLIHLITSTKDSRCKKRGNSL